MHLSRSFLCLLSATIFTLASSENRCMLPPSPKANCEETSWVAIQSVQDKNIRECKERRTCNSSNYFSSKEDCEESCALKCQKPPQIPPYRPNSIIVPRMEAGRIRYGVFSRCAIGYTMIGDDERICQDNGNWSGQEPHCYKMLISVQNSTGQYPFDSNYKLEVEEAKQLKLSCSVEDKHLPEFGISWKQVKDGNVVDLPMMHDVKSGMSKNGDYVYIQFDRVTRNAHERTYSCISHSYPHLSRNVTLKIKPKDSRAPEITFFKKKVDKTHLRLNCHALGTPAPSITLLKDGIPVDVDPFKSDSSTAFQHQIDNPGVKDIGNYECKADNKFGKDVNYETVSAQELGITTTEDSSGSAPAENDTNNSSVTQCNMCPHGKVAGVKTCNSSNTVVSAQVMEKIDKENDVMYKIKEGQVIKGSNTSLTMIKISHEALACNCPPFNSHSWYVFTGTVEEDMLIVTDKDTVCAVSKHSIHTLERNCRAMV